MRSALKPLPGVVEVTEADPSSRVATVKVDPNKFDAEQAIAKLADENYGGAKVVNN